MGHKYLLIKVLKVLTEQSCSHLHVHYCKLKKRKRHKY